MDIACSGACCDTTATASVDAFSFNLNCANSQTVTLTMNAQSKVVSTATVTVCSMSLSPAVVSLTQAPAATSYSFSGSDTCGLASYTADIICPVSCTCDATASASSGAFTFHADCPASSSTSLGAQINGNTQIAASRNVMFTGLTISAFTVIFTQANTGSSFTVTVTLSSGADTYTVSLTCPGCTCASSPQTTSSGVATFSGVTCSSTGSPSFTATLQENTDVTTSLSGSIFDLSLSSPTVPVFKGAAFSLVILAQVSGTPLSGVQVLLANLGSCSTVLAIDTTDATGLATFSVTCTTAGSYTFTVADNTSSTTTTDINVSVYELAISYDSTTSLTAATFTVTVNAKSSAVISGMPLVLTDVSGTCTVGASTTTNASGDAAFSMSCPTSNTYSVTAANTATPAQTQSGSIVVFDLAFVTPPTTLLKDEAFSISATDLSNSVNQDGVTLYLQLTGGSGSLSGTASAVTASGTASYSFLSITDAGAYTLKVSANSSGSPAKTTSINVYKLVFTQQPTNVFST